MDLLTFRRSLDGSAPPPGLDPLAEALWWEAKGDWTAAHERAQAVEDARGARVHAYLHRREGDLANAGHWYRRAGVAVETGPLDAEWDRLVQALT